MIHKAYAAVIAATATGPAGCGYSPGARALSGGAVTSPTTANLGRPIVGQYQSKGV